MPRVECKFYYENKFQSVSELDFLKFSIGHFFWACYKGISLGTLVFFPFALNDDDSNFNSVQISHWAVPLHQVASLCQLLSHNCFSWCSICNWEDMFDHFTKQKLPVKLTHAPELTLYRLLSPLDQHCTLAICIPRDKNVRNKWDHLAYQISASLVIAIAIMFKFKAKHLNMKEITFTWNKCTIFSLVGHTDLSQ